MCVQHYQKKSLLLDVIVVKNSTALNVLKYKFKIKLKTCKSIL